MTVTGLIPNSTVVVVETRVPPNYVLDPTPRTIIIRNGSNSVSSGGAGNGGNTGTVGGGGNDQTVEIRPNNTQTITIRNTPTQALVIQKFVTGSKDKPLAGVEFLVTDSDGTVLGPNNGIYRTDQLAALP